MYCIGKAEWNDLFVSMNFICYQAVITLLQIALQVTSSALCVSVDTAAVAATESHKRALRDALGGRPLPISQQWHCCGVWAHLCISDTFTVSAGTFRCVVPRSLDVPFFPVCFPHHPSSLITHCHSSPSLHPAQPLPVLVADRELVSSMTLILLP